MKIYSVSEFVSAVSDYLEQGLGSAAVQGEVVDYKVNQGRLVFFELKDDNSRFLCFTLTHQVGEKLEDGTEVRVLGVPKLFKKSGKFHLYVQEVELVGEGALQKAFEKLKKKLSEEGLFEKRFKKPLPRFPESIGLITSRDAAAYNDVLIRLDERWSGLEIRHAHVGVQGLGAVSQIVRAVEYINKHEPVDVMILTRGGGSLEDLQAFNNEQVVRAVFSSKIPIVVGVGHERDVTLAELAADARASTPTNAAELVVPHRKEIGYQVEQMRDTLERRIEQKVLEHKNVVTNLTDRVGRWLGQLREKFAVKVHNLENQANIWLINLQQVFNHQMQLLKSLSPQATLKRGYSITLKDGKVIRSQKELKVGDFINTQFSQGEISSEVTKN